MKTFACVAREGSITRAAERLFLSQPAVSAHIKGMEDELGLALFDRTARGMRLTSHGQRILAMAEHTIASHRALIDEAAMLKGRLAGRLRIGISVGGQPDTALIGRLLPRAGAAVRRHPASLGRSVVQARERGRAARRRPFKLSINYCNNAYFLCYHFVPPISKATISMRHLRPLLALVTVLASINCAAAQLQTGSGDTARVFRFEPRVEDGPGDLHGQVLGRISVLRADGHVVYAEDTPLQAGCGKIAAISQLTPQLVALCGTLGGRHTTHKVFRQVGAALEIATLDLQDGSGPLAIGRDGRARGMVMRRDVFPGMTGPRYFPLMYALYDDPIAFGFRPDFSSYARAGYHRRYNELRHGDQPAQAMPEILAMLLAMQEPRLTCRELSRLETILIDDGQYAAQPDARDFLRQWMAKLPSAGYPGFDEAVCKDY